ncbi:MAG: RagB/SusD family nutrient uptake outer membrane protein [Bacteroidales bacterium]|nr:RagB/SusD family nutrient uptake outer membrane protein [Bacteroidales bacterium]
MKKIILYIVTTITLLSVNSCSDWLELIPPDGLVRNEYWQTKEDLKATLMGAYQAFAQLDEILFELGELRGDMIVDDNSPAYLRNIMEGNIYPNNNLTNWADFYEIINYVNNVLKYNPIIFDIDQTYSEYQMLGTEAEALFIRSLAYFYLVRTFKDVPLVLEPSESDDVDFFLPKSADTTILRIIKTDLLRARQFVTGDYGSPEENKGRATKAAINSLLADISLWNFEYEDVIKFVEAVEVDEKDDYFLMQSSSWFEIFYPGNSFEGIFEFQFDASLNQNNSLYDETYNDNYYLASLKALELLDISKELNRGNGSINSNLKIWKYSGAYADGKSLRPSSDRKSGNWIIYRLGDLLLMKAEALSQLSRFDEALEIVNNNRERVRTDLLSPPYTVNAFEDMILQERAIELAFEGKRWFDLLRMGRRNNYSRKSELIEILIENVPSTQKLVLASKLTNPYGWYLPIEDVELERNKNLIQNPYYADFTK